MITYKNTKQLNERYFQMNTNKKDSRRKSSKKAVEIPGYKLEISLSRRLRYYRV